MFRFSLREKTAGFDSFLPDHFLVLCIGFQLSKTRISSYNHLTSKEIMLKLFAILLRNFSKHLVKFTLCSDIINCTLLDISLHDVFDYALFQLGHTLQKKYN